MESKIKGQENIRSSYQKRKTSQEKGKLEKMQNWKAYGLDGLTKGRDREKKETKH